MKEIIQKLNQYIGFPVKMEIINGRQSMQDPVLQNLIQGHVGDLQVRWFSFKSIRTMDYIADRINIHIDADPASSTGYSISHITRG